MINPFILSDPSLTIAPPTVSAIAFPHKSSSLSSENDLLQGQPKTIEIVRLDRGRSSTKKTMVVRNSLPPLLPLPPASTHSTNRSENPGPSKSARQSEAPDFYRRPDRSTIRASDFDNDPLDDPVLPIAEAR